MEGPIEAGCDVTAGSTVYNFCTVNGLAMANVVDALAAIKKVVFEDQLLSLSELAEAMREDFAGRETLRQALLRCPKYGNDQHEPDRLLRELSDDFVREIGSHRNGRGGRMQCGLYTVDSHGFMGQRTGALPDGRRRGVALANALSPAQGADTSGPTAVIRSCTKLNHSQLGNGMVLDIKFTPSFFAEMRRQGILRPLVETYFRSAGWRSSSTSSTAPRSWRRNDRRESIKTWWCASRALAPILWTWTRWCRTRSSPARSMPRCKLWRRGSRVNTNPRDEHRSDLFILSASVCIGGKV